MGYQYALRFLYLFFPLGVDFIYLSKQFILSLSKLVEKLIFSLSKFVFSRLESSLNFALFLSECVKTVNELTLFILYCFTNYIAKPILNLSEAKVVGIFLFFK